MSVEMPGTTWHLIKTVSLVRLGKHQGVHLGMGHRVTPIRLAGVTNACFCLWLVGTYEIRM